MPCQFVRYPEPEDVERGLITVFQEYLPQILTDISAYRASSDTAVYGAPIELSAPLNEAYWIGECKLPMFPNVIVDCFKTTPVGGGNWLSETTEGPSMTQYEEIHHVAIECFLVDSRDQVVKLKIERYGNALKRVIQEHPRLEDASGAPIVKSATVGEALYGKINVNEGQALWRFVSLEAQFRVLSRKIEF